MCDQLISARYWLQGQVVRINQYRRSSPGSVRWGRMQDDASVRVMVITSLPRRAFLPYPPPPAAPHAPPSPTPSTLP